jgi:SAM-dependent MidA family methyltransferase
MQEALYGPAGFYRQQMPGQHFRTSATATPLLAGALATLVTRVDDALDHPDDFDLVDVGAGDGALLAQVVERLPTGLRHRIRPIAVDVRERPDGLDQHIVWSSRAPDSIMGVVMAHELLDNVPCDAVERESGRLRQVLVTRGGDESLGGAPERDDLAWLEAWWPLHADGDRAEVGTARDLLWSSLVKSVARGAALSADYGHLRAARVAGHYAAGTITGYRDGHQVAPTPDGTCDITAHVAMDACAHAGVTSGRAETTVLLRQHDALRQLGLDAGRPDLSIAHTHPAEYLRQLSDASSAAELLDPASLGSFWWLVQCKGVSSPIGSEALSL